MKLLNKYGIHIRDISEAKKTNFVENKYKSTCSERYGCTNVLSKGSSIRDLMELSVFEKYGVDNVFQIKEVIESCQQRGMETKYRTGQVVRPELRTDWEEYKRLSLNKSKEVYEKLKHIINEDDLPRSRGKYHLDHMVSVRFGFDNNIPIHIICHPMNLTMLPEYVNISKCSKCSITIEELYNRIDEWNNEIENE